MKKDSKTAAFFYAEEEAAVYNTAIEMTQPQYQLLHSALVDLLGYHLRSRQSSQEGVILDLGCGTGAEALRITKAFPGLYIVAVDFSQPMLDVCASEFRQLYGRRSTERCRTVLLDLLGRGASSRYFLSLVPDHYQRRGYLAVVTAFAFHHFTYRQKRQLFRAIFECLEPGGLFLNGDLFVHQSSFLTKVVLDHTEEWIERQFSNLDAEHAAQARLLGPRALELKKKWLEHVRCFNRPTPLEGPGWVDTTKHTSDAGLGEVEELRRVGFAEVGCPFRYFQAGIIWARK